MIEDIPFSGCLSKLEHQGKVFNLKTTFWEPQLKLDFEKVNDHVDWGFFGPCTR